MLNIHFCRPYFCAVFCVITVMGCDHPKPQAPSERSFVYHLCKIIQNWGEFWGDYCDCESYSPKALLHCIETKDEMQDLKETLDNKIEALWVISTRELVKDCSVIALVHIEDEKYWAVGKSKPARCEPLTLTRPPDRLFNGLTQLK